MQTAPVTPVPRATSPPLFLGEHRALDFLNTLAAPAGEVVEWVGTGEDLVDWLVAAQLVPAEVAQPWRGAAGARFDTVAGQARELREWFRGFVQRRAGRPLTRSAVRALEPLNRLMAYDSLHIPGSASRPPQKRRRPPIRPCGGTGAAVERTGVVAPTGRACDGRPRVSGRLPVRATLRAMHCLVSRREPRAPAPLVQHGGSLRNRAKAEAFRASARVSGRLELRAQIRRRGLRVVRGCEGVACWH